MNGVASRLCDIPNVCAVSNMVLIVRMRTNCDQLVSLALGRILFGTFQENCLRVVVKEGVYRRQRTMCFHV